MPEELEQHRITGARLDELYAAAKSGRVVETFTEMQMGNATWDRFDEPCESFANWAYGLLNICSHARVRPEPPAETPKQREWWLAACQSFVKREEASEYLRVHGHKWEPTHVREVLPGDIDPDKVIVVVEGTVRGNEFGVDIMHPGVEEMEFVILFDEVHEDRQP